MKRLRAGLTILALTPYLAQAHPGHAGADSPFHGLLHPEHLLLLLAIGVAFIVVKLWRKYL